MQGTPTWAVLLGPEMRVVVQMTGQPDPVALRQLLSEMLDEFGSGSTSAGGSSGSTGGGSSNSSSSSTGSGGGGGPNDK